MAVATRIRKQARGVNVLSLAIGIYAILFAGALLFAFALCKMASDSDSDDPGQVVIPGHGEPNPAYPATKSSNLGLTNDLFSPPLWTWTVASEPGELPVSIVKATQYRHLAEQCL